MSFQSFKKYEVLTRKAEAERMKAEQTRQLDAMTGVTSTHSGKAKGKKKKKGSKAVAAEPEQLTPQDELPISMPQPVNNSSRRVVYRRIPPRADESAEVKEMPQDTEEPGEAVSDNKDGVKEESVSEEEEEEESEEEKEVEKKKKPAEKAKETSEDIISDTYNGAALDNYKWSQTMTDIDVRVPVVSGTKGKDVSVEIKSDHLKVVLHRPEKKVGLSLSLSLSHTYPFIHLTFSFSQVVIDGQLLHKVKVDDSLWSIDSTNHYLTINLEKTKEIMWKSVLVGEEGIDLTKVDTTRDISEFDPECQAAIQRVTYDHHMKMLGKPTSGQAVSSWIG